MRCHAAGWRPTRFTELPSCESQVSRLCEEIDDRVKAFLDRPIEGDWPYLWLDATYVKVRQNSRVVSVAVIVAVGVNSDGRREVLGMDIGPSEAETFWTAFLRKLRHVNRRRNGTPDRRAIGTPLTAGCCRAALVGAEP